MEAWILAAESGDMQTLERLEKECSRSEDRKGQTALMHATEHNSIAVVKYLAAKELRSTDEKGQTALFYAESAECALILAEEVDISDGNGDFPLHIFAAENKIQLVEIFADHCKEENAVGKTPLHIAAQAGYYECCILLSNALGIKDHNGKYALLGGICSGSVEIVRLLKKEVNAEALRFALLSDDEMLQIIANEAKEENLIGSMDEFTRSQVYEALNDESWKPPAEEDEDSEFESIKQQLEAARRRCMEAELPDEVIEGQESKEQDEE